MAGMSKTPMDLLCRGMETHFSLDTKFHQIRHIQILRPKCRIMHGVKSTMRTSAVETKAMPSVNIMKKPLKCSPINQNSLISLTSGGKVIQGCILSQQTGVLFGQTNMQTIIQDSAIFSFGEKLRTLKSMEWPWSPWTTWIQVVVLLMVTSIIM